ncbi:hypothetical protein C8F04DRAFT_1151877 [Mycena alexandri]|uniref:BTB domain-containing protein n=1 Tax=Mycena alexandri TaxID=1745969 RepID=A0AAD6WLC0_9AGAR|nr:hypothetical protein C8F04DRAFT_1151877 [Mycena alexandri]
MSLPAPTITRSKFWYSDGSVILQAEATQFSPSNSAFFRDMQSLPQPPDQPTLEGCPVIELPDDDVIDVGYLLEALYSPPFLCQTALPLPVISAHIRLGRKYDFRELLDLAVARLNFENPTTLAAYDALLTDEYDVALMLDSHYTPTRIVNYPGLYLDIIRLAREHDILSVLPCAYYRLLISTDLRTVDELFLGIKKADGSRVPFTPDELRRCVSGREKIMYAQLQPGYGCGWYRSWVPSPGCANPCTVHQKARRPPPKSFGFTYCQLEPQNMFRVQTEHQAIKCRGKKADMGGFPTWSELSNFS